MSGGLLIDSDVLIDVGNGVAEAADRLRRESAATSLTISVITQMELFVGARDKSDLRKTVRFLKRFMILKVNGPIGDRAVALIERCRFRHGIGMADALIAATALAHGYPLLPKNRKHYHFIRGLVLPAYP